MKIKFKNGSEITTVKSNSNFKSKRSELISFYCINCDEVHIDYPISKMMIFGEEDLVTMCSESFEKVIKPYLNNKVK